MNSLHFGFIIVFSALVFGTSQASDHIDGVPSLGRHEQVDLTDLYSFPTQGKKDSLTVILNLYPGVKAYPGVIYGAGHFSSKVSYEIFIKPVSFSRTPETPRFKVSDENSLKVNCSFVDPAHHSHSSEEAGEAKCVLRSNSGKTLAQLKSKVGDVVVNKSESLKMFTGHRADAFFLSAEHFSQVTNRENFPEPHTDFEIEYHPAILKGNLIEGTNVLSIVLEIDLKDLVPNSNYDLLALAAQSYTTEKGHKEVLDRVGRPEITNLSLHDFSGESPLKVSYNKRSAFGWSPYNVNDVASESFFAPLRKRLVENISSYDELDNNEDWEDSKKLTDLANILLSDFLVVDVSKVCNPLINGFFEIERSFLLGVQHTSCGGRQITDDIMATLFAIYVGGVEASVIDYRTGVDKPYISSDLELSAKFPYLASPWKKQWNTRRLLYRAGKKGQEGKGE